MAFDGTMGERLAYTAGIIDSQEALEKKQDFIRRFFSTTKECE